MVSHKKNLFQVILYLTLLTSSYLSAQEISPLFTSISKESSFVNADQAKIYDEYALDEKVLYTQFVRIDDLRNFLVDNSITFNFPPVNAILTAKTNYTEKFDSENYVWNGVFPNEEGDITIISEGTSRYGNLTYKDHFYSFEDTGNGLSLIKEIETPEGEAIAHNDKTDEPTDISELAKVTCDNNKIYNVDVLFLFTEKVGNLSKATKIANSTITEMNLICKNSSANATFTSVGIEPMPIPNLDKPDGPNFYFAPTLPARIDGAAADLPLRNLRESKGADIVFILYNGPTQLRATNGTVIGNIFGMETQIPLSKSDPYFLIHKDFATHSKYQIAMVLGGRSLGAGTEILAGRYPDSRPHKYGSKFSVMHHAGPKNKSKFISNPKVSDGGVATGIVDKEDNVKAINTTVCTVSSYFDSEKPAKSEIIFDKPCIGKPFEIWIDHSGFKTNTNTVYQFSYSTDGKNYSTPVSQKSIFYTMPKLSNTNLVFVKVTFIDLGGYLKTTILRIPLVNCLEGDDPTSNKQVRQDITISPNPANDEFNVLIEGMKNKNVILNILDTRSSKTVKSKSITIITDESVELFKTEGLMSGIYYLQLLSDGINITKPIIISHE